MKRRFRLLLKGPSTCDGGFIEMPVRKGWVFLLIFMLTAGAANVAVAAGTPNTARHRGDMVQDLVNVGTVPAIGVAEVEAQSVWTRTVQVTRTYYSLVGLAVARHYATTWWTYGGGYLYSSPRGYANDWWTAPLNYVTGSSGQWDWYHVGQGGTGRSNLQVTFVFGVPTPWGPIGSTYSSRIFTWFNGWGDYSYW